MNRFLASILLTLSVFVSIICHSAAAVAAGADADDSSSGPSPTVDMIPSPMPSIEEIATASTVGASLATAALDNAVPFDNLAANLPEAFSALENQFSDEGFQAMLTSQLGNPHAVEMFQSLIHDPNAINSISALLDDPKIQSSLSVQFVQEYLEPAASVSVTPMQTHESTGVFAGPSLKKNTESESRHSSGATASRPHALVLGCLLTIALGFLTPA
ncbi:hypothetical protein LPJ53_003784 [Coemansia erecta]|uniref:CUE domain-containing protein n=1 Tax=Coemansia erecta TaxID=147472 RepID=A0A9W7Y0E4_9FUNG|nr:hypothetical protein LPJ53_003784 [Coemansia erecta]